MSAVLSDQHEIRSEKQPGRKKARKSGDDQCDATQAADAQRTIELQAAEIDRLHQALQEARGLIKTWGGYAGPYFQKRCKLDEDLARIDAVLSASLGSSGPQQAADERTAV